MTLVEKWLVALQSTSPYVDDDGATRFAFNASQPIKQYLGKSGRSYVPYGLLDKVGWWWGGDDDEVSKENCNDIQSPIHLVEIKKCAK